MSGKLLLPLAVALIALLRAPSAAPAPSTLVQDGKQLYGRYCVACHGGNGAGVSAGTIGAAPQRSQQVRTGEGPSLRGVCSLAADFYLRTGYMPLQQVGGQPVRRRVLLGDAQIRALVAYVASLAPGPAIPRPHPQRGNLAQGMHLFTESCSGCHQVAARGGVVSGAVPPPLTSATDVQIAEAVRLGPYVMPRFTRQAISDRQLDSIIRYVDYTKHADNRGGWSIGDIGPVPEGLVTWFLAASVLVALCVAIGERFRHD